MPSDAEEIAQLKIEVARLGRIVDDLARRLGDPGAIDTGAPDAQRPPVDVVDALQRGSLIEAIKLWRGYTGSGLAQAKAEVEQMQARLGL